MEETKQQESQSKPNGGLNSSALNETEFNQPESISPEDKTYLSAALADYTAATQVLQQAQEQHAGAQGVLSFLNKMLSKKYALSPGDQIKEDGQIVRVKPE